MWHLLQTLTKALIMILHLHVGIATTFSGNDPSNPDPRLYCTNRIIDDKALIVAHPKFPCGSKVLIYSLRTKLTVVARVLDRGPRHASIDMSIGTTRAIRGNGMEPVVFWSLRQ